MRFIDLHEDLLLHINHREHFGDWWQTDFEQIKKTEAAIIFVTAFPNPADGNYASSECLSLIRNDLESYVRMAKDHDLKIMLTATDIADIMKNQNGFDEATATRGLLLHAEGLDALPVEKAIDTLEAWKSIGLRSLGISWNLDNAYGGSCSGENKGLTEAGRHVVTWLRSSGMILDFAHMSKRTFAEAATLWNQPILVSHAGACGVFEHERNIDDEQLEMIRASNGIIGIFAAPRFLAGQKNGTLSSLVDHIRYVATRIGIEHVGIGTDFGGLVTSRMDDFDRIEKIESLSCALRDAGFSEDDMRKIFYENAMRVMIDILR